MAVEYPKKRTDVAEKVLLAPSSRRATRMRILAPKLSPPADFRSNISVRAGFSSRISGWAQSLMSRVKMRANKQDVKFKLGISGME